MARYDNSYGYGVDYRHVSLRPQWNDPQSLDPNYQGGGYHGMRMEPGTRGQAAYGWQRQAEASDLGRYGGFDGRYGGHRGGFFDREGLFRDPFDERYPTNLGQPHTHAPLQRGVEPRPGYAPQGGDRPGPGKPRQFEHQQESDGGVRHDNRFLRQYNANSVALREGRGYDRGFGWADRRPDPRADNPRNAPTHEHGYAGWNSAGWSDKHLPASRRQGGR